MTNADVVMYTIPSAESKPSCTPGPSPPLSCPRGPLSETPSQWSRFRLSRSAVPRCPRYKALALSPDAPVAHRAPGQQRFCPSAQLPLSPSRLVSPRSALAIPSRSTALMSPLFFALLQTLSANFPASSPSPTHAHSALRLSPGSSSLPSSAC
ncbi:hypothetical protein FKP32DRAFT_719919 [Trametes sanguinea]|nr:hypothetical protein FKP32DRAFT_719919 [Trametes sanguinea]